jgi:parallel beta-helix repeat protein
VTWFRASIVVSSALGAALGSPAAEIAVPVDHVTVQAAIAAADPGDEVVVAAGEYLGDIDFLGKAIVVRGAGATTVLRGTGTGPVVTFATGETADSVLDSVVGTGGAAPRGGGIRIVGASPRVRRAIVRENSASASGSGIWVEGPNAAPHLHNNLIVYNTHTAGDPHAVQAQNADPRIENNTIVRNDSNGIFVRGTGTATIVNNVIAWNGSRVRGEGKRGRGICDFTDRAAIRYNVFHRNRKSALLRGGTDYRRIAKAERRLGDPGVADNVDRNPRLAKRRPPRRPDRADASAFLPRARSALHDGGDPDPAFNDVDGSRNTVGHTGGPWGTTFQSGAASAERR